MDDELIPNCTGLRHWFEAAWSGGDDAGFGVIFCRACGEIRRIEIPSIEAPIEESITSSVPTTFWRG